MDINRKHADLALVVAIKAVATTEPGKLNKLFNKCADLAQKERKKLPSILGVDGETIVNQHLKLSRETGWNKKPRHPLTFVNFILSMMEDHDYPKIVEVLDEITEYYERGNNAPAACFWAGDLAYQKWVKIVN